MPFIPSPPSSSSSGLPAGSIVDFGGSSTPSGWLLCDGSVVAQATYPDLFTNLSTTWNTGGEGAGNFRLPDLRGRSVIGSGTGSGLTARTTGQQTIGVETHTLSGAETGTNVHSHTISNTTHVHGPTGHTYWVSSDQTGTGGSGVGLIIPNTMGNDCFYNTAAQTSMTWSPAPGADANVNANATNAHQNMQPSAVCTKIIKATN